MIATGAPLGETLDHLAAFIEAQIADTACAILLADPEGRHLRLGGIGKLPAPCRRVLDDLAFKPACGPCCADIHRQQAGCASDITNEPQIKPLAAAARAAGLTGCTSTPILSPRGDSLGSLVLYHGANPNRRATSRVINTAAHIATIAIEAERSQQAVHQQLHFMQQLVDTIPCPVFFKDEQGRYLGGNHSYEQMIGVARADFIGKTVYDIAPKELADRYRAADDILFANGGTQVYEAKVQGVTGPVRNVMFHKATFSRANGRLGGLVGVVLDITDAKIAEAKWAAAAREAAIANQAKSDFLAQMSHELRTPLNAIIGFSEAMKLQVFGPLSNPHYESYAADIYQSGHLLLSLINDILDLSKIEAGKYRLHLESIDLRGLVLGAVHMVEQHAREARVSLTVHLPERLPPLLADRRAVIRIVLNLLSNAIKFTPAGGKVELHCVAEDSGAIITVADTGIGMAPAQIPVALSTFGQLDNAYARRHQGTGLGLPMVKALTEQHGGELKIESELDKGTTVTIRLPGRADRVRQG